MAYDPSSDLGPEYMARIMRRLHTSGPQDAASVSRTFARIHREAPHIAVECTTFALNEAAGLGYVTYGSLPGGPRYCITPAGLAWLASVGG